MRDPRRVERDSRRGISQGTEKDIQRCDDARRDKMITTRGEGETASEVMREE